MRHTDRGKYFELVFKVTQDQAGVTSVRPQSWTLRRRRQGCRVVLGGFTIGSCLVRGWK